MALYFNEERFSFTLDTAYDVILLYQKRQVIGSACFLDFNLSIPFIIRLQAVEAASQYRCRSSLALRMIRSARRLFRYGQLRI